MQHKVQQTFTIVFIKQYKLKIVIAHRRSAERNDKLVLLITLF